MDATRLEEMRLLAEAGEKRKNAETTVNVVAIAMSKSVEAMKNASKAYASAVSQLASALPAAHEMSHEELKMLKKLLDQTEETRSKLKKYSLYAEGNVTLALKLKAALAKPMEFVRPVPPDPDKPFYADDPKSRR